MIAEIVMPDWLAAAVGGFGAAVIAALSIFVRAVLKGVQSQAKDLTDGLLKKSEVDLKREVAAADPLAARVLAQGHSRAELDHEVTRRLSQRERDVQTRIKSQNKMARAQQKGPAYILKKSPLTGVVPSPAPVQGDAKGIRREDQATDE